MAVDRKALRKAFGSMKRAEPLEKTHIDLGLVAGSLQKSGTALMDSEKSDEEFEKDLDLLLSDIEKVEGFVDTLEVDGDEFVTSDADHEFVESFKAKKKPKPAFLMSEKEKKALAEKEKAEKEKAKKEKAKKAESDADGSGDDSGDAGDSTTQKGDGWERDMAPKLQRPQGRLERMTKREVPIRATKNERSMEKHQRARDRMMGRAAGDNGRCMS